jgi:hypothetical protein
MKTNELTSATLDWAAAMCEGFIKVSIWSDHIGVCKKHSFEDERRWAPSTNWAQGGPIIEREEISVNWASGQWQAHIANDQDEYAQIEYGPTPLIAAMRCYVASKLGDEVQVPEELEDEPETESGEDLAQFYGPSAR